MTKKVHLKALETDQDVPACRSKGKEPLLTVVPGNVTCPKCHEVLSA